jgi:hypothetical protein
MYKREKNRIHLLFEQIPEVKSPMPVFKLGVRVVAPDILVRGIVRDVAPNAEMRALKKKGGSAAYEANRLVSFVHPETGETNVFPALESLTPAFGLAERAKEVAARFASDTTLFPKDGTHVIPLTPVTLLGSRRSRDGARTPPAEYLSFVRFERRANGLPVFGPGTKAMIAVTNDGSVRSFSHRFRHATETTECVEPFTRERIAASIREQLAVSPKTAEAKVDAVTLGYYDGGGESMQPVFRFEATIASPRRPRDGLRPANRRVFGYVSIGRAPEALPILGSHKGPSPEEPSLEEGSGGTPPPGDPTIGRYVVRDDSQGWVDSANGFWANLSLAGALGSTIPFTNSQYYWAEPFEFVSNKNDFVNSVNIALTEVHGNWDLFSTRDNHDDLVSLNDIPSDGYGAGGGGSLAFWILHSCEVIPTQTDESTSFDIWWKIFNGLHAVVGYRTEMWINDGVTSPFGLHVGLGAPIVSAWFSAIASNGDYGVGDTWYLDNNRNIWEPMGRASAVAVSGHGDDTANDVGALAPPSSLTEWWFGN